MLDLLKQIDVLTGLVLSIGGAMITVVVWWERRNRTYTDHKFSGVVRTYGETERRLEKLEGRVGGVEVKIDQTASRISEVEGRLGALASSQQVADLRDRMGKLEGSFEQMGGKVDTIYRAALQAQGDRS